MLRKLEELKTRNVTGEKFSVALDKTIRENLIPNDAQVLSSVTNSKGSKNKPTKERSRQLRRKIDIASHFILRAAYCKTEDLRRWFLSQETYLFKYQLEKMAEGSESNEKLKNFLSQNDLHFDLVHDDEKRRLIPNLLSIPLISGERGNTKVVIPSAADVTSTIYFKIPFKEATDLIAKRQCFVKTGYAYVPMRRIVSIITGKFRIALSKSLAQASRVFANVTSDFAPVAPLLNSMNSQYTGKEYNAEAAGMEGDYQLTSGNIETYKNSMPLCMAELHSGLKADHKLRHHGRLQYGLFLKGAGMTMEESLIFFQKEFTKIMSSEKFQKEYTYNIRHMYGKEGKRTNYTPFSCTKIILGTPPSTGDHHGCPYRHYDDEHLAAILGKLKIGSPSDRSEIMNLKKTKHFNLACQRHFQAMHPSAHTVPDLNLGGVGDHPNAWYAASVAYHGATSGSSGDVEMKQNSEDTLKTSDKK